MTPPIEYLDRVSIGNLAMLNTRDSQGKNVQLDEVSVRILDGGTQGVYSSQEDTIVVTDKEGHNYTDSAIVTSALNKLGIEKIKEGANLSHIKNLNSYLTRIQQQDAWPAFMLLANDGTSPITLTLDEAWAVEGLYNSINVNLTSLKQLFSTDVVINISQVDMISDVLNTWSSFKVIQEIDDTIGHAASLNMVSFELSLRVIFDDLIPKIPSSEIRSETIKKTTEVCNAFLKALIKKVDVDRLGRGQDPNQKYFDAIKDLKRISSRFRIQLDPALLKELENITKQSPEDSLLSNKVKLR